MVGKSLGSSKSSSKIATLASVSVAPIPRANGSDRKHHTFPLSIKQNGRRVKQGGLIGAASIAITRHGRATCSLGCSNAGAADRAIPCQAPISAVLRCSRMVETGLCDNRRTVGLEAIERQVIEGIEKHL